MPRGRVGWAVAAAGFVVAAAVGLVVWLAMEPAADGVPVAAGMALGGSEEARTDGRPSRRAAAASDASGASVEIDDAPMPADAKGTIRGTVRDDLGRPIAEARVEAAPRPVSDPEWWNGDYGAVTVADGKFVITDVDPLAVWQVRAYAEGHARSRPSEAVVMTPNRLDVTYDLVVPRLGLVEATVLNAAGSPLEHTIRVLPLDGDDSSRSPRMTEVGPGRWRVFVDSPGHAGDSRVVDVAAGETTRVEFRLGEEVEITGTVLDSDGTPAGRLDVVAVVADGTLDPIDVTTRAAADGTFRLRGLRRTQYRLGLGGLNFLVEGTPTVMAPATGVTLRVREDSKVTFRLVYPPGFPDADRSADVSIDVCTQWHGTKPSPRWDRDQGTVWIPGGEDVDLTIIVLHCAPWQRRVRARPGEVLDIGDVRPDLLRDIEGNVADAAGKPVHGASVRCGRGRFGGFWVTDVLGAFRIERRPLADCVLEVEAPGFVAKRVDCRANDTAPLTVKLERGGVLWIRAASPGAAPFAAAAVRIDDASGTAWWAAPTTLDDRGECAVRLAPGRWRITVAGCAPAEADVREGAATTVRISAAR